MFILYSVSSTIAVGQQPWLKGEYLILLLLIIVVFSVLNMVMGGAETDVEMSAEAADGAGLDVEMLDGTSDDGKLDFPGEHCDGIFTVIQHQIYPSSQNPKGPTLKDLQVICTTFNLPKSGKKADIQNRLRKFSRDRVQWGSLLAASRRSHKSRDLNGSKSTKKSAIRRKEVFGSTDIANTIPNDSGPRLRLRRSPQEIQDTLAWAKRVVDSENQATPVSLQHSPLHKNPSPIISGDKATEVINYCVEALSALAGALNVPVEGLTDTALAPASMDISIAPLPIISPSTTPPPLPSPPPPSFDIVPEAVVSSRQQQILHIAGGRIHSFFKDDIPPPSAFRFAQDMESLTRVWDDGLSYWDPSGYNFRINGQPIALKYWPKLFRGARWEVVKNQWHLWKFVMESYTSMSSQSFWARFSVDGKRMSFTAISTALRDEREEECQRIAACARLEYGDQFAEMFKYRKGSQTLVMTKDSAVAKRYQELQRIRSV
ncbi:hypothetical protein C8J56DRAFT_140700 [Mycena floridula]|nr:hypothetical protein C8J56DRAFT_140700 [Mycena floridula]